MPDDAAVLITRIDVIPTPDDLPSLEFDQYLN
jgi:hypothetical protein